MNLKFLGVFWSTLWYFLGSSKILFSASHHPNIDGQTEVNNKTQDSILRALFIKTRKD